MAKPRVSALEDHIGYWLRYVSNQVSHAFSLKAQEQGVTVAEWVVLRELSDGARMPSALADKLGMTRGAISKLADRLVDKKLLVREFAPEDHRCQILALTRQGRALVPVVAALADANDAEFFGHLDDATRRLIVATMRDIVSRKGLQSVPID